jgi:homoserine kinase
LRFHIFIEDQKGLIKARYVMRCHGQRSFPPGTHVHVINPIPLGRGLGSSGAAVVAGVALGNEVGNLGLSKARMLVSITINIDWKEEPVLNLK